MSETLQKYNLDKHEWNKALGRGILIIDALKNRLAVTDAYPSVNNNLSKQKQEPMGPKEFVFWLTILEERGYVLGTVGNSPEALLELLKSSPSYAQKPNEESSVYNQIVPRASRKAWLELTTEEFIQKMDTKLRQNSAGNV